MLYFNTKYAQFTDEELAKHTVLAEPSVVECNNPLAVELAKRLEQRLEDADNPPDCTLCDLKDCDYCDTLDELLIAEGRIKRLEATIKEVKLLRDKMEDLKLW